MTTSDSTMSTLAPIDVVLITLYFVMVAAVGVGFCIKERRRAAARHNGDSSVDSSEDFFLAGRSQTWPAIGLSLFVSNIGSEHMLGLAGSAASGGIAVGWFEWSAGLHILVLGWLFAPIYHRSGIATLPEYVERRYNKCLRSCLSCASIALYVFTKLSVSIDSGATVLHSVFGLDRWIGATGLVVLTAVYTAMGGLAAVIVTDVAQSVVLIVGAACMAAVGFQRVGGLDALRLDPPSSLNRTGWQPFFHMYRPMDDPKYPTLGLLIGQNVGGLWYWCLDQAIVQRVLSAKSVEHARAATVFAGFLKITPVFIMVLPGLVARKLFDAEFEAGARWDEALPLMMKNLLPHGLLGLNLAATIAACMSSLDSVFTAAASLFCLDLYRGHLRQSASDKELVAVGRAFCVLLAILTICWLPIIDLMSDELFGYIQSISLYLSPPIVSIYFLGVCWRRANVQGAVATFIVGYTLGLGRMLGEIACKAAPPAPGSFADLLFVQINFLYVGAVICAVCFAVQTLVTLRTAPPRPAQVDGLTVDWTCMIDCLRRSDVSPATRTLQTCAVGVEMQSSPPSATPPTLKATGVVPELHQARSNARPHTHTSGDGETADRWSHLLVNALSLTLIITVLILFACWM